MRTVIFALVPYDLFAKKISDGLPYLGLKLAIMVQVFKPLMVFVHILVMAKYRFKFNLILWSEI